MRKFGSKRFSHFFNNHLPQWTRRRTQCQRDLYSFRAQLGAIHKPEVDNIHAELGIVYPFQGL